MTTAWNSPYWAQQTLITCLSWSPAKANTGFRSKVGEAAGAAAAGVAALPSSGRPAPSQTTNTVNTVLIRSSPERLRVPPAAIFYAQMAQMCSCGGCETGQGSMFVWTGCEGVGWTLTACMK